MGLGSAIILIGLLAGTLSFLRALEDANEILDSGLHQTASLIRNGQVALPPVAAQLHGTEPDNDMFVVRMSADLQHDPLGIASSFPTSLPAGLQNVNWDGKQWRVLVENVGDGERVAIAQQSEVRDEIARSNAFWTIVPLLVLLPVLILLGRELVRRTLAPVSRLAQHIDSNPMLNAANLPSVAVPSEVQPFVHSIERLLADLSAALSNQQRFVANAAHELRTPIAALRLQADNVESVLRDPLARERLATLEAGIERIQQLLEQLLSMARSQAGASGPLVPVDLAEGVMVVLAELMPAATQKSVDLGIDRCEHGIRVHATPIDIATLVRNVAGNAIKHCGSGAVISLSVFSEGADAVLRVEDDGPGIGDEHLEHVFEPFYRAQGSGQSGSGLGLSIVAAIGERLGGRISLGSGPTGRGVRFEYRQPLCA
jgi:signal transduction histidine kinase